MSVRPSVTCVLYCFVTNPKNLPVIFLYHILITANMQLKTGFPSSHQLRSYVAPKSRLKFAVCCPVSSCWPSCPICFQLFGRKLGIYVTHVAYIKVTRHTYTLGILTASLQGYLSHCMVECPCSDLSFLGTFNCLYSFVRSLLTHRLLECLPFNHWLHSVIVICPLILKEFESSVHEINIYAV